MLSSTFGSGTKLAWQTLSGEAIALKMKTGSVPVQSPVHWSNMKPVSGEAVRVTSSPGFTSQSPPLQTPKGAVGALAATEPLSPASALTDTRWMKPATTAVSELSVTTQLPRPEQPPPYQSDWKYPEA